MRQLFVDTSAYFALTDKRDESHEAAIRLIRQIIRERVELLTTNYIVAETKAFCVTFKSSSELFVIISSAFSDIITRLLRQNAPMLS